MLYGIEQNVFLLGWQLSLHNARFEKKKDAEKFLDRFLKTHPEHERSQFRIVVKKLV